MTKNIVRWNLRQYRINLKRKTRIMSLSEITIDTWIYYHEFTDEAVLTLTVIYCSRLQIHPEILFIIAPVLKYLIQLRLYQNLKTKKTWFCSSNFSFLRANVSCPKHQFLWISHIMRVFECKNLWYLKHFRHLLESQVSFYKTCFLLEYQHLECKTFIWWM